MIDKAGEREVTNVALVTGIFAGGVSGFAVSTMLTSVTAAAIVGGPLGIGFGLCVGYYVSSSILAEIRETDVQQNKEK